MQSRPSRSTGVRPWKPSRAIWSVDFGGGVRPGAIWSVKVDGRARPVRIGGRPGGRGSVRRARPGAIGTVDLDGWPRPWNPVALMITLRGWRRRFRTCGRSPEPPSTLYPSIGGPSTGLDGPDDLLFG